jgi:hypothetical protein
MSEVFDFIGFIVRLPLYLLILALITPFIVPVVAMWLLFGVICIIFLSVAMICFDLILYPVWIPFPFLWALLNNDKDFLEPLKIPNLVRWFLDNVLREVFEWFLDKVSSFKPPYRIANTFLLHGLSEAQTLYWEIKR